MSQSSIALEHVDYTLESVDTNTLLIIAFMTKKRDVNETSYNSNQPNIP